jgi:hypothetical protein
MIIQDYKWLVPSWEWSVWQLSIVTQQTCAGGEEVKCNSVILSHFVADETGICTQISRQPVQPQVFNTCQSHTNPLSTGYLKIIENLNTCCWLIGIGQSTLTNFYQFQVFKPLGTFALESFTPDYRPRVSHKRARTPPFGGHFFKYIFFLLSFISQIFFSLLFFLFFHFTCSDTTIYNTAYY